MNIDDFHKYCIRVIKKNPKDIAIKMISKQKNTITGEKLGMDKATKMYNIYVDKYCVKYDFEKYDFNMSAYYAEKYKIINRKK